ncbi:hypothetical protein AB0M46_47750 [Dactylosporangium sp. NPDC051485]|uniref:hypothetical protein n=1 Tax=Dactylosporangium sp. NPDC051485 TaxID=3154846 RepID=UPI003415B9EE
MTEQRSPWAEPDTHTVIEPVPPASTAPIAGPAQPFDGRPGGSARVAPQYASGRVSRLGAPPPPPPPDVPSGGRDRDDDDPVKRNQRILKWLGGGAILVVAVGLIVILVSVLTNNATTPGGLFDRHAEAPSDTRPELARRCPPPSIPPDNPNNGGGAEVPPGPRTTDSESGISYKEYGAPWRPLLQNWRDQGELRITYRQGQDFVTEPNYDGAGHDYHATILSGHVPAAVNDGMVLDLHCVGDQIAADVRISFYPKGNQLEQLEAKDLTLGGRPARLLKFRLHFSEAGLTAKSELVSIALVDLGKPEAAILYVSIPDTHRQYDYVADEAPESIRPV